LNLSTKCHLISNDEFFLLSFLPQGSSLYGDLIFIPFLIK